MFKLIIPAAITAITLIPSQLLAQEYPSNIDREGILTPVHFSVLLFCEYRRDGETADESMTNAQIWHFQQIQMRYGFSDDQIISLMKTEYLSYSKEKIISGILDECPELVPVGN